jgi:hypothetical protein
MTLRSASEACRSRFSTLRAGKWLEFAVPAEYRTPLLGGETTNAALYAPVLRR